MRALFFDPKRYDLTKVGRYKLDQRLGVAVPEDVRVLTPADILALVRKLVDMPVQPRRPGGVEGLRGRGGDEGRDPIRAELDEYEHFGNRRLRTTGELIQEAFRVGLYRMERVVRERMTTEDVDTITPHSSRVLLVAEITRTSTLMVRADPSRSTSPSCRTRRTLAWVFRLMSPISSRKIVPRRPARTCRSASRWRR